MLHWYNGTWEHRAYWGANLITYGGNNTAGRHYMGPLPAAGQWVRLDIPASAVGLEGSILSGMDFSQYNGRATWDKAGNATPVTVVTPPPVVVPPTVTVIATDATATIGATDTGTLTFTRTGSTTTALTVNYVLSGSAVKWTDYRRIEGDMPVAVTIPAGATATTMTIMAVANVTNANPETAIFTLSADPTYAIGANSSAILTIGSATTIPPVTVPPTTGILPSIGNMDYTNLTQPLVGEHVLQVLTPTLLELRQLNTKQPDPARVGSWDFVDANNQLHSPSPAQFAVTANGQSVSVLTVGFKRRPLYAPLNQRDLRIDNALYLQLASPLTDGQAIEVKDPDGQLWATTDRYTATVDPLRYNPAIHVNQEGYVPELPKKAMIGYYLGNLGEMDVPASLGFKIVATGTGATVFQGALTARQDVGYVYTPLPYQKVLQADFSSFTTPGEYYLVVPGLGASLPFLIDEGIAMGWMRTYALGLYFQRSGMAVGLPFTRFAHDADHTARAQIPSNDSDPQFAFTWTTIAGYASTVNTDNPPQVAPLLTSEANSLYPYVNTGTVDVSGGHFDAGDYSKYTINSAALVHYLMFTADAIPGAGALDNLGIPESGDGIGDVLQEAKWEADYIAKLQDADGGFYFIVYPRDHEYESNVSLTAGDDGDPQVVWPKNTSATAAAVAALAQCASSPQFKLHYPTVAALYLQKATLGWQFLMNAIAQHGRAGIYQKITFYGDHFADNDELAWAACEMYLATGDPQYQAKLFEYFPDPSDSSTFRWGWWRMSESYGNAIRSYAFAVRTGRLQASQLNAAYLAKCEAQIVAAGDDALLWSNQNAYASSFPMETKHVQGAGWYFSLDQASDMAVAYQINPKPAYIDALVGNLNYEGGTNPVNVTYITGLGLKRQHEIVSQYANNDDRVLPPDGIPLGNIQASFDYLPLYGSELSNLTFPSDGAATSPYPYYDRWADTWNVTTEFVSVNQARSLLALSVLVAQTSTKSQAWKSGTAQITVPTTVVPVGLPTTLSVQTPGLDLTNARVVWEARDQQPAFGLTYTLSPVNNGPQWVEVEVEWPDGRRVFATSTFMANSPVINWVNGAVPAGGAPSADGGDAWKWVTSNPAPYSAPAVHQSNIATGEHSHWFTYATATLDIAVGDSLFAYVYLDPANPPSEVMLTWNDASSEHRAYWGANSIAWGTDGSAGRYYVGPLPAVGQWVRLTVPASAVGLEGSTVNGMGFSLFNGRATWDVAGKAASGH
ncbi:MAG TPA: glycoside hydrolase family 9 protein [Opitutaceae bacterium]|nr:glycoside hydrolase family 9 protein [Opitutaceae bacterium]